MYINHRCNLSCNYCYLKSVNDRGVLSPERAEKIIDNIIRISKKRGLYPEIGLFGKEPLLNFELVKLITEYIKRRKYICTLSINTNGSLIKKERLDYLVNNNFRIVLSSDRYISNKHYEGRLGFSDKGGIDIRTTISARNLYRLPEIIGDYIKRGFLKVSVAFDYTDPNFIEMRPEYISDILIETIIEYINLKKIHKGVSVPMMDRILMMGMRKSNYKYSPKPFCQLGDRIYSIDINGDVYPCWRFVGMPEYRLGNIEDEYLRKKGFIIEIGREDKRRIGGFDFLCYWACSVNKSFFENNLKIMQAMNKASQKIRFST